MRERERERTKEEEGAQCLQYISLQHHSKTKSPLHTTIPSFIESFTFHPNLKNLSFRSLSNSHLSSPPKFCFLVMPRSPKPTQPLYLHFWDLSILGFNHFHSLMASPYPFPLTAAQVFLHFLCQSLVLFMFFLFIFVCSLMGFACCEYFRLGLTLLGSTIRFFSISLSMFISFTLMPAPCFVLMVIIERLLLQCW